MPKFNPDLYTPERLADYTDLVSQFKKMTISVENFDPMDNTVLKITLACFKEIRRKGFPIPSTLLKDTHTRDDDRVGAFRYKTGGNNGSIILNYENPGIFRRNLEANSSSYQIGKGLEGLLWHECGHLYHFKTNSTEFIKKQPVPLVEQVVKEVSKYAAVNSREFVAEVFSGINNLNKHFDPKIMAIYNWFLKGIKTAGIS